MYLKFNIFFFGNNRLKGKTIIHHPSINMQSKQPPFVVSVNDALLLPGGMNFVFLLFTQPHLCTDYSCAPLCFRMCDTGDIRRETANKREGEKIDNLYIKRGWRYQRANQVETSCGQAQETFEQVLLTFQKAE